MAGLLDPIDRSNVGLLGKLAQTWPARMAGGLLGAMTLPGDVYSGRTTPDDPQYYSRATDLAGMMMAGATGAPRGALGSGPAGALAAKTAPRTERFNWPVSTEYGRVVDMPIVVNPSRGDIQSALSNAPHGDVRALRAPDGSVYLWPANEAMHVDIANTFDLPFKTRADLQSNSYLFNKRDIDSLGKFNSFDDMVKLLSSP